MIYQGNSKIKEIYYGGAKIKEIYYGSSLVYSSVPTPLPEVATFISAGGLGANYIAPLNRLVTDLKNAGIWSKMIAIYPMVGNTFNSLKLNLNNNSNYNLFEFEGSPTYGLNSITATGVLSTGIYDMSIPSYNLSFSILSMTDSSTDIPDMCSYDYYLNGYDTCDRLYIALKDYGYFIADTYSNFERLETLNTSSTGFYTVSRTSSNAVKAYKNGLIIDSNTYDLMSAFYEDILIGGSDAAQATNRTYTFASIGEGLTDTEASNLYSIVNTFRQSLS